MHKLGTILLLIILTGSLMACAGAETKPDEQSGQSDSLALLRKACMDPDSENSIAACRKVLKMQPNDPKMEHCLGWQLCLDGKLPEGIAHLRKSCKLQPEGDLIHYHLGVALEKRGDRSGAVAAFKKSIKLDPKHTESYVAAGILLRKMGKKPEAEKMLRQAIKSDPKSATALAQLSLTLAQLARSNLGLFMTNAGQAAEAIEQLSKAVEIDPQNATAQYNLGLAYTKTDALEEAARAYFNAILTREDFPQAQHNLAVILIGLGLCKESKSHLDRSHELGVKSAPIVLEQYKKICEPAPEGEGEGEAEGEDAASKPPEKS